MFCAYYSLRYPLRLGRTLFKYNNVAILSKTITTTPIRSEIFNIGKRMRNEQYYKKLDKIDPTYELIYRAPLEYLTSVCRHVPTFALITVSAAIAYKLAIGVDIIEVGTQLSIGPTMADGTELIGFGVAFFLFNITLVYVVTKYPLRIYKSKNKYIAMFEGFLPLKPKKFSFLRGDVRPTKSILPWKESIYKMNNKTVLVYSHHFKRPADFNEMFRLE